MIEGLKPYAEYKESGQTWLGRVPAHWRTPRLKTVLREKEARSLDGAGLLLSLTRNRGLIARSEMTNKIHSARTLAGYKLYDPGEIVMNRMQAWSGMFGAGKKPGLVSPDYAVFKLLGDQLASFLLARIKAPDLVSQFALESKGIGSGFNRLYSDRFGAIAISLPPLDEQAAIVRFLDHANRKIDGFIRAKRKLIGLLNEQKQAIIHRAVTSGLDPNVHLKASGIPWLGEIPAHWEVRRLRFCIRGKLTYGANAAAEFDNPEWPRYLRITDFNGDGSLRPDTFRSLPPEIAKDYPVEDGDILFARSGATVGKAFIVRTETVKACYAGYLIRARPNTDVVMPAFLFAFTQSTAFVRWKDAIFNRATIQNIGADKYANLVVPIPPIAEQQSILDAIDKDLLPLRIAIARTEREITLMQEYRTRLTADIVTGKLDVREAAARLPDLPTDSTVEPFTDEGLDDSEIEDAEA